MEITKAIPIYSTNMDAHSHLEKFIIDLVKTNVCYIDANAIIPMT